MKKSFVFIALVFFALFSVAQAAEILGPEGESANITVGAAENRKNLYSAGRDVTVNGNIAGDLTAAARTITLIGSVEQDALLAGGLVVIAGDVGGDVRILAGEITVSGPIGGDLVAAGGDVELIGKASVAHDAVIAGRDISIESPVKGNLRLFAGSAVINSRIEGNVYVQASKKLVFGPQAEVLGKIVYKGPKPATVASGAKIGAIDYAEFNVRGFRHRFAAILTLGFLVKLAAWILAGFLLLRYKRDFTSHLVFEVQNKPWENLGIGLLAVIAIPLAVVLLLVTAVGYYVAILAGLAFLLLLAISGIVSAIVAGYIALKFLSKPGEARLDIQSVVLGAVIWSLLKFIPVVGWVVMAIVFLQAFGALAKYAKNMILQKNN